MAFYDEPRFTEDIDLVVFADDFGKFKRLVEKRGYFESAEPWRFQKIDMTLHRFMKVAGEDHLILDALVPEPAVGRRIIENAVVAESEHGKVWIASREDLIWLKSLRNSKQDQVDIERLRNDEN